MIFDHHLAKRFHVRARGALGSQLSDLYLSKPGNSQVADQQSCIRATCLYSSFQQSSGREDEPHRKDRCHRIESSHRASSSTRERMQARSYHSLQLTGLFLSSCIR